MKTKILSYRTVIEKDGRYYHGFVPSLAGCHTQGRTIEETRKHLREAIIAYLQSLKKHKEPIPQDNSFEAVEVFDLEEIFSADKKLSYA